VGFGGISVGGMVNNRKWFGRVFAGWSSATYLETLNTTHFRRGEPEWGAQLADELERIVQLHDASTICSV